MKVIVLNGCPLSGKDSIADYLVQKHSREYAAVEKKMFKDKLIEAAVRTSGVSRICWDRHYQRDLKELPWDALIAGNIALSPRQYLIHISENVMKPLFGEEVFGLAAAESLTNEEVTYVFSDGGFSEELKPVIRKVGESNFFLARLHRDGYSFDGDSRRHVFPSIDNERDFYNNTSIEEISEQIWQWMRKI